SLGAKAVATTSAGLAWSNGYRDGSTLPTDALVRAAAAIARVVKVPVSIDLEDGYSDTPGEVADLVERLIDLGVVGINLQDGFPAAEVLRHKIEAVRTRAQARGVDLYVNARTDRFLKELGEPEERLPEVLKRGRIYREAGASGLFVPRLADPDGLRAVVGE